MSNIGGLVAQTLLEGGLVAWAGWEIWSLRTKKAPPPAAPSDPAGHAVGEEPLDDRRA